MFDYETPKENFGKRVYSQFQAVPRLPYIQTQRTMTVPEVVYHLKKHIGMVKFYFYVADNPPTAKYAPTGMVVSREHIIRFMEDKTEEYAFYCFKKPDTKVMHVEVSHLLEKKALRPKPSVPSNDTIDWSTVQEQVAEDDEQSPTMKFLIAESMFYSLGMYPPGWDPLTPIPDDVDANEVIRDRAAARRKHSDKPVKQKPFKRLSEDEFDALSQEEQEAYEQAEKLYDSNHS